MVHDHADLLSMCASGTTRRIAIVQWEPAKSNATESAAMLFLRVYGTPRRDLLPLSAHLGYWTALFFAASVEVFIQFCQAVVAGNLLVETIKWEARRNLRRPSPMG